MVNIVLNHDHKKNWLVFGFSLDKRKLGQGSSFSPSGVILHCRVWLPAKMTIHINHSTWVLAFIPEGSSEGGGNQALLLAPLLPPTLLLSAQLYHQGPSCGQTVGCGDPCISVGRPMPCILLATTSASGKGRHCVLHFLFQVSRPSMLPRQHSSKV